MIANISRGEINGRIAAPPSKSFTHRAIVTASLAEGTSTIINPLASDDTDATTEVLRNLGVSIKREENAWKVFGGELKAPKNELFCMESGTTLRFTTAICSLVDGRCTITGAESLIRRPIGELVNALRQLGAKCHSNGNFPPVITENSFIGGTANLRGDISSQFISALLLVAPLGSEDVKINLNTELESLPYVMMTLHLQALFGVKVNASKDMRRFEIERQAYKPARYRVEGDWSSAAFLLAGGALSGKIEVTNLDLKSRQADRSIMEILGAMGAKIKVGKDSVIVEKSDLKAIDFNVSNCPDLFPVFSVLCSAASGKSRITGIERLKIKESDRVGEMEKGLTNMGIDFRRVGDAVEIKGSQAEGGIINSNDHRIAMSFGMLGTVAKGKTVIRNAQCVSKSFPEFWNYLAKLNANTEIVE